MAAMWQLKPDLLLFAVVSLGALACTVAGGKPVVTAISKDPATLLYGMGAPVQEHGGPTNQIVLDLSGPLIWTNCPDDHVTLGCNSVVCMQGHRFHPPNCPHTGYGKPDADNSHRCKCTAHPYNPVSGETASDDMTEVTTYANATDGKNPLYVVPVELTTSCAPVSLFAGLPEEAVGVVGLGRSALALPAQVAKTQKVNNTFALCLPGGSGNTGVAIFGGGPLFLLPPGRPDIAASLVGYTPLVKHGESPGYYISAEKGIAVNHVKLPLDGGAYGATPLLVGLSLTIPYTALRSDVYRAFIKAFDETTAGYAKMPAVAPFELCYNSTQLGSTRVGYPVPEIELMLAGGKNWILFGGNSMVDVNDHTACLAFVEMKGEGKQAGYGGGGGTQAPAMVIGGFQMENNLLVFDEENQRLGFSSLLFFRQTTCSNFNFTMAA